MMALSPDIVILVLGSSIYGIWNLPILAVNFAIFWEPMNMIMMMMFI
jgi:hypothetical protein